MPNTRAVWASWARSADHRIVAVHDQRSAGQLPDRRAPAPGDMLELTVAVELVAEEVREQERTRLEAACHLWQRGFVDLEQAELGVAAREEGGGDARDEVGSGRVVCDPYGRTQDLRDHRGRGRLAVGRGHEHGSPRQPPGERVDRARVESPEQLARDRRPTASAGEARERARRPERSRLELECQRRPHRADTVTGGQA